MRRAFVLGGGAAVATMGASGASAAVVTTTTNILVNSFDPEDFSSPPDVVNLDIDADGVNDFTVTHTSSPVSNFPKVDVNGTVTLTASTVSQYVAVVEDGADGTLDGTYAEDLDIGDIVGGSSSFIALDDIAYDPYLLDDNNNDSHFGRGAFSVITGEADATGNRFGPKYVGIAFGDENNPFFGYIEFMQIGNDSSEADDSGGNTAPIRITGFAYETEAGTPITIVPINVPEPGTLALAAAGGAAVLWPRRRRG